MDYVDRFACDWHRLATTDPKDSTAPIICRFFENSKRNLRQSQRKYKRRQVSYQQSRFLSEGARRLNPGGMCGIIGLGGESAARKEARKSMNIRRVTALLLALMLPAAALAEVDGMSLRRTENCMVFTSANGVDTVIRPLDQPFMGETALEDGELIAYLDYADLPNEGAVFLRLTFSLMTPEMLGADTLRLAVGGTDYVFPVTAEISEYDATYFEDYAVCLTEASLPVVGAIIRLKGAPVGVSLEQEGRTPVTGQVVFPAEQVQAVLDRYEEVGGLTQALGRFDTVWPVEISR